MPPKRASLLPVNQRFCRCPRCSSAGPRRTSSTARRAMSLCGPTGQLDAIEKRISSSRSTSCGSMEVLASPDARVAKQGDTHLVLPPGFFFAPPSTQSSNRSRWSVETGSPVAGLTARQGGRSNASREAMQGMYPSRTRVALSVWKHRLELAQDAATTGRSWANRGGSAGRSSRPESTSSSWTARPSCAAMASPMRPAPSLKQGSLRSC